MMSGSCRKNARKAEEKVSPTWALTCTWFIPLNLYSTGSSTVQMLTLGSLSWLRQE